MPPGPPELAESVQQHDQLSLRAEVLADGDVEANPVGGDVAMTPRPFKQDVAYAGSCHRAGMFGLRGCCR